MQYSRLDGVLRAKVQISVTMGWFPVDTTRANTSSICADQGVKKNDPVIEKVILGSEEFRVFWKAETESLRYDKAVIHVYGT